MFSSVSQIGQMMIMPFPLKHLAESCQSLLFALVLLFISSGYISTQAADVQYKVIQIQENSLTAYLYVPEATQPKPAVIVLGGSSGRLNLDYSRLLASHGIVAMSLRYFNGEQLPQTLDEVPVETVVRGIDYLQTMNSVDASKIGILGVSRGSELAFLGASIDRRIQAVVGIVPSSVAWQGQTGPTAWTYKDKPIPGLAFSRSSDIPILQRASHALERLEDRKPAFFEFEKINGPILLISANKDHIWPSEAMSEQIVRYLNTHDFKFPVQHMRLDNNHFIGQQARDSFEEALIRHFEFAVQ